ncbi:HAD-IIIC family phosphatase [Micromonospora rifamycinica]|uniref:HAD-IIIC family phosphatase n=1 Tax=Micromonospora rifamycinica TaxID=291594 RepID=UPI00343B2C22
MSVTTKSTAHEELLRLHRGGGIEEHYPELPRLLAAVPDAELARAGRLLASIDVGRVLAAHPAVPSLSVAVTGHGTLSALVPALAAETARHGILPRLLPVEFDGYVRELADPDSGLRAAMPDLVLCVLDPAIITEELPVTWEPADVDRVLTEKVAVFARLAEHFATLGHGTLVMNTIPLPQRLVAQLVDQRSRARLGMCWRSANVKLLGLTESVPGLTVVDLDPLLAEGCPLSEPRMDVYAKAHLSAELLSRYAREVVHIARHLVGRVRKCLVLDLDQTVWGGTVGDDGIDGIEVAEGYRGEAYTAFQRVVKQLATQGVLLAAVSKNDPEPVSQVFREHPRMTLREDDFVRMIADWSPKHDNLRRLARSLNLGLDSLVFVDDSPYECGLVRRELPEVEVVQLDEEPALHVEKLLRDAWFLTPATTAEDRKRTTLYREELARSDFLLGFDSITDYLRELGVVVRIEPVTDADVARVSQLSLRTNQFNLTTLRLQPADVRDLLDRPDRLPLVVRAADRFGDNGLVGAVFLRAGVDGLHIDNFLLSCRVFGRGIEQTCLAVVLKHAQAHGHRVVFGYYRETAKNGTVRKLYPRYGFVADPPTPDAVTRFRSGTAIAVPDHVKLTDLL